MNFMNNYFIVKIRPLYSGFLFMQHKPFGRTDVSWNLDGTVMALGNEDG